MTMRITLALAALLLLSPALPATAAVNVERGGSENPMVEVARSTMYGGLTGLVLGSAIALANDGASIVRWGFVGGTLFGFGYGIYHVQSRPRPRALLEVEDGRARLATPDLALTRDGGARVALVGARF